MIFRKKVFNCYCKKINMEKKFQITLAIFLTLLGILALLYGDLIWEFFGLSSQSLLINSIIINIFVYVLRTIIVRIVSYVLKTKIIRFLINFIINIIWIIFVFELIYTIEPTLGVTITSFIVVAVSLTFRDRINNVASGILILASETFDIGDLIEVNGIQGFVQEIDLNYTKIRELNGLITVLPNSNIFNAATKKFTQRPSKKLKSKKTQEKGFHIKEYADKFTKIISKEEKLTRYIKTVEILSKWNPAELENILSDIFDRYKEVFGFRPFYYINQTFMNRCNITLQIVSREPQLIALYYNAFLRDVLFILYPEKIFMDWDGDRRNIIDSIEKKGGVE